MSVKVKKSADERVEFRVSNEDKELFDYARQLSGFKTFSEFARFVITKESKALVKKHKSMLTSAKDKDIFFKALMGHDHTPNDALISAIQNHDEIIKE